VWARLESSLVHNVAYNNNAVGLTVSKMLPHIQSLTVGCEVIGTQKSHTIEYSNNIQLSRPIREMRAKAYIGN